MSAQRRHGPQRLCLSCAAPLVILPTLIASLDRPSAFSLARAGMREPAASCGGMKAHISRRARMDMVARPALSQQRWNRTGLLGAVATAIVVSLASANAQEIHGAPGAPNATMTIDGHVLPPPPQKFGGDIELNAAQSKPYWPMRVV